VPQQPAAQQVPAAQRSPRQQVAAAQQAPADAEAVAANQQWLGRQGTGPDMSERNQADLKGEVSKVYDAALSGTAPPRIQTGQQSRPAGERPVGNESHRSSGPGADRRDTHER
jgi:hypothetical protein